MSRLSLEKLLTQSDYYGLKLMNCDIGITMAVPDPALHQERQEDRY